MSAKHISLIGVNHKSTPLEVREKISLTGGYEETLTRLRDQQLSEYYILSTCNRVELIWVSENPDATTTDMLQFLFGAAVDPEDWGIYSYVYHDDEAVNHLFRVSSSLDSLVVGEAQILGQIKEAYRYASEYHCTGPLLNKLLHKSFSVAKRVRSETEIGSAAVSISSAAVELARKIFGDLSEKNVLLIGAGEMAELAAEHLLGQGVAGISVAKRTLSRAVDLAKRFNGNACSLDELTEQMETVDIIISSTGASGLIIQGDDVKQLMRIRRNRPLFFIDIAVPRDLDPGLNEIENVFLYDIDDLSQVVEMNRSGREKEAVKASRIVDEETLKFSKWQEGLTITPTISALRQKADHICSQEIERTLARMDLSVEDRRKIEKLGQAITAKMLYDPMKFLKSDSCRKGEDSKIDMVRMVFGLEHDGDGN